MDDIKSYEKLIDDIFTYCQNNGIGIEAISDFIKKCCVDVLNKMVDFNDEFLVLKKNCRVESFDTDKLYNSIANASDAIGQPLNDSEIKNIISIIKKNLSKEKKVFSSKTIRDLVLEVLKDFGYDKIYESYKNYSK